METLKNDIVYALGRFIREPMATFIIVLTLALGIGATTAIFSVVNGVLLNAAPFKDAERLVNLRQFQGNASDGAMGFSVKEIADYRAQISSLDEVSEYHNMTFTLYGHGDPKRVNTGVVSVNHFPMLGVDTIHGRLFNPGEDDMGAAPLILLSYEYWVNEFGADPSVVGQSVEMNNRAHEIIGVLRAFPQFPDVNDVYMALPSCPWRSGDNALENRSARFLRGFGKLKADVSLALAQTEMSTVADRMANNFPEDYSSASKFDASATFLVDDLISGSQAYLFILLGTTLLVLLISSANVTNLILSQHTRRQREFAVRRSLGATRGVLAKQLLTESVLLAIAAGLLGLCFAYLGLELLQGFAEHFTSRANQIVINFDVMLFTFFLSLCTGIIAGILPSLTKTALVSALKEGGKASNSSKGGPLRNILLILQFALSLTLLVVAVLSIQSLEEIQAIDPGYETGNTQAVQLDLNWTSYSSDPSQWQMTESLLREVEALPYVGAVAASFTYPMDSVMSGAGQLRAVMQLDDRPYDANDALTNVYSRSISPGYFDLLGIKLMQGRDFSHHDAADNARVIVINKSSAEKYWPNESALEHKLSFDRGQNWLTIIGVVADVEEIDLASSANNQFYIPMAQSPSLHVVILADVNAEQRQFESDFREIVSGLDSQQAISKFESLQEALDNTLSLQQFIAKVLMIFAAIAMFITISGISGVLAYLVSLRTREIGIRMALGANRRDILIMILSYSLRLAIVGFGLGLVGAWLMATALDEHLYSSTSNNVGSNDIAVYAGCLVLMLLVTLVSSFLPSYQASRMNPNRALKL